MGLSELFFGKRKGKTAFGHFRDYVALKKEQRTFSAAFNPLNLRIFDFIDIFGSDAGNYQCESIFWYQTDALQFDVARYALKNVSSGELQFLEVFPNNEGYFYALFKLVDQIDWDTDLIHVIEHEDILRHTEQNISTDYVKDFILQSQLTIFSKSSPLIFENVITANYFFKNDKINRYLSVDLIPEKANISFFAGFQIQSSDFAAFGTAT